MESPQVANGEFVDSVLVGDIITSILTDTIDIGQRLHTAGLFNPASLVFTPTNLVVQVQAPDPFRVLFGSGRLVGAHGTVAGADTTTYNVNMASLVPGSGSVTAYIIAAYGTIGQDTSTVVGPPPGHPDFDPNFAPFEFDRTVLDTLLITGSLTAPNNTTTFELARITLSVGQAAITAGAINKANWRYGSAVLDPQPSAGTYTSLGGANIASITADGRASLAFSSFATNSGTANALAATLVPAPTSYAQLTGFPIRLQMGGAANTAAVTLNVNGLGARAVTDTRGAPLSAGYLAANGVYEFVSNGTNFQVLSHVNVFNDTGANGFEVIGTGANGAGFRLSGTGTNPRKSIRAVNSNLEILNSAYTNAILTLGDNGDMLLKGSLGVYPGLPDNASGVFFKNSSGAGLGGVFSAATGNVFLSNVSNHTQSDGPGLWISPAGDITSSVGNRFRSALGAIGSGDLAAVAILNDFTFSHNAGNDDFTFQRLPSGWIIQTYRGVTVSGVEFVTFPIAFPTGCSQVLVHEGAPGGWIQSGGLVSPTIFGSQQLSQASFALYVARLVGTVWSFSAGISYRYIAIGY